MKVAEEIRKRIKVKKIKQCDVAKAMGWTPQSFTNRLTADTFPTYDLMNILDYLGYDLVIKKRRVNDEKVEDKIK